EASGTSLGVPERSQKSSHVHSRRPDHPLVTVPTCTSSAQLRLPCRWQDLPAVWVFGFTSSTAGHCLPLENAFPTPQRSSWVFRERSHSNSNLHNPASRFF